MTLAWNRPLQLTAEMAAAAYDGMNARAHAHQSTACYRLFKTTPARDTPGDRCRVSRLGHVLHRWPWHCSRCDRKPARADALVLRAAPRYQARGRPHRRQSVGFLRPLTHQAHAGLEAGI